jgi:hypothetical protein
MIERDDNIPALKDLVSELDVARAVAKQGFLVEKLSS